MLLFSIPQVFNIANDLLAWIKGLDSGGLTSASGAITTSAEKLERYIKGKQPAMPFFEACRILDPQQLPLISNDRTKYLDVLPELRDCTDEWSTYLSIASTSLTKSPQEFWNALCTRLPKLSQAALTLLAVPPHSVDVERSFSKVKMLLTPQRRRLTEENVERLVMLYHNANLKHGDDF